MSNDAVNILLVDDEPGGLLALETILEPLGQKLALAGSGREALRALLRQDFAVVVLDVLMPDMDGFETAELIRQRERSRLTPIIFLTALHEAELARLKAYAVGAVDYLIKPCEPVILRSKVSVFVELQKKNQLVLRQAEALRESAEREQAQKLAEAHRQLETERLKAEEALLRRELQLRDEFLSVASHELRTPLTPLQVSLQMAVRKLERMPGTLSREELDKLLERLVRNVGRLTWLVNSLLDVTRIEAGKFSLELSDTNLTELILDVTRRFEDELSRVGCTLEVDAGAPVLGRWDRDRLDQVVANLLSNAVKYAAGKPVLVSLRADERMARIVVEDHGIGIAPEAQARIFQRFERAVQGQNIGGLGLGLWIVREIVHAHGGEVQVESCPDKGSRFTVCLPRQREWGDEQVRRVAEA